MFRLQRRSLLRFAMIPVTGSLLLAAGAVAMTPPPSGHPGQLPTRLDPAKPTTTEKADTPSIETIMANYVKAIGGEEKLRSMKSRKMTGRFEMEQMPGMSASLVMQSKAPNMMLMTLDLPGMGQMMQGFDGKTGWSMDPMSGPMLMPPDQLTQFKREANFFKELELHKGFDDVKVVGKEKSGDREVWVVRMKDPDGEHVTLHFDVDDHLLRRVITVSKTPMGEVPSTTHLKEYRDFDGYKTVVRTEIETMGMKQTLIIDTVEIDVVEKSTFDLPAPIKSLVEAQKGREKDSEKPKSGS